MPAGVPRVPSPPYASVIMVGVLACVRSGIRTLAVRTAMPGRYARLKRGSWARQSAEPGQYEVGFPV